MSNRPDNGMQLSLLGNVAREEFCGTQVAIGFNFANKDMNGAQISAGVNIAQRASGMQAGPVNILLDSLDGVQGGVMNIATGDVSYVQAGVRNIARDVGYFQAGVMNIARDVGYVQAGIMNIAEDVGYVQAGVMNIAGSVGHFQGGVMNIANRTTSRQVGIVNIATYSEKTPIGLLNIVGNGIIDVTFYGDIAEDIPSVSLRMGTPWFYTVMEYGQLVKYIFDDREKPEMYSIGFGTRFGMNGPLHTNVDFVTSNFYTAGNYDEWYWGYKLRIGGSYMPLSFLAVTGGLSLNGRIEGDDRCPWPIHEKRFGSMRTSWTEGGHRLHVWPGLYAGITLGQVKAGRKIKVEYND
jgi:hypothetical protein